MSGFLYALLPVIAIVSLGHVLSVRKWIPTESWRAIERLSYVVLFPALIVRTLANAPFETAPWRLAGALILAQFALAGVGLLGRFLPGYAQPGCRIGHPVKRALEHDDRLVDRQSSVRTGRARPCHNRGRRDDPDRECPVCLCVDRPCRPSAWAGTKAPPGPGPEPDRPRMYLRPRPGSREYRAARTAGRQSRDIWVTRPSRSGLLSAGAGVSTCPPCAGPGRGPSRWSLVRLVGLPVFAVGFGLLAGPVGHSALTIAVICAATPTATSSYILARELGGDAPLAANLIAVETVLAMLTMPLLYLAVTQLPFGLRA